MSGMFIGLVLGGVLAPINWRLIFLVSVPIGLFGTVWGYIKLREAERPATGTYRLARQHNICARARIGHGRHYLWDRTLRPTTPWGGPTRSWWRVLLVGVLPARRFRRCVEVKAAQPMFRLQLFKIRAFTAGVFASFLAVLSRGGLVFMLIIWLQGIWLPLHGYDFARTPLWAGLAMLPLTAGFLIRGAFFRYFVGPLRRPPVRDPGAWSAPLSASCCWGATAHRLLLLGIRRPSLPSSASPCPCSGPPTGLGS